MFLDRLHYQHLTSNLVSRLAKSGIAITIVILGAFSSASLVHNAHAGFGPCTGCPVFSVWAPYGSFVSALDFKYYATPTGEFAAFTFGSLDLYGSPLTPAAAAICAGIADFIYSGIATNTCALKDVGQSIGTGVVDQVGRGYPNFWTALNGENNPVFAPASPAYTFGGGANVMRWGEGTGTTFLNPYLTGFAPATANAELDTLYEVYDTLFKENPTNPAKVICWMCSDYTSSIDGAGNTHFRVDLRPSLRWHDGVHVDCNDVKFTLLDFKFGVGPKSPILAAYAAPIIGVTVNSPTSCEIVMSGVGPSLLHDLSGIFILPDHIWDSGNGAFGGGIGTADPLKALPIFGYDPITSGTFIGSGPFMCKSLFPVVGAIGTGCSVDPTGALGTQTIGPGGQLLLSRFDRTAEPLNVDPFLQYMRSFNSAWGVGPFVPGTTPYSGQFQEFSFSDKDKTAKVDLADVVSAAACFAKAAPGGSCPAAAYTYWLRNAFHFAPGVITTEVFIAASHFDDNWVFPYAWNSAALDDVVAYP